MQSHNTTDAHLCECGCGQPTNMILRSHNGLRRGQYSRFIVGHSSRLNTTPLPIRFWSRVDKTDSCWLWTGTISRCTSRPTYGVIGRGGRGGPNSSAHRVSYELHFGPIPDGMLVCHTCDNGLCVNPAHLFLGTAKDNMHDMINKGRDRHDSPCRGEQQGSHKLTDAIVQEVRCRYATEHIPHSKLAKEYGVAKSAIGRIIRRQSWRHVH